MFCQQTKEYLSQMQIPFEERDITKNAETVAELKRLGYMTTPVIMINRTVVVGFDLEKIQTALRS